MKLYIRIYRQQPPDGQLGIFDGLEVFKRPIGLPRPPPPKITIFYIILLTK